MSGLLHEILEVRAAASPDRVAVRSADATWTYAQIWRRSAELARWLRRQGTGKGDRVLVNAPHDPETVAVIFAASLVGAMYVIVSDQLPAYRLEQIVADARPRVILVTERTRDAALAAGLDPTVMSGIPARDGTAPDRFEPSDAIPVDPVSLIYTSGSTSSPKAVVSTHRQVRFAASAVQARLRYRPDDVVFCCMPLSFDYGLYQVFLTFLAGAELVLGDARDAGPLLVSRLESFSVTVLPLVPTLAQALATLITRAGHPPPRLRMITSSGAALSPRTADRLRALVPGLAMVSMFGLTECKRVSIMEPNGDVTRPGAVGRPLPGTEAFVVDENGDRLPPGEVGELVVRGEHVMAGYWRAPELTAARFRRDAFGQPQLHTGDRCHIDADGYLYFVGRTDDLYKEKGYRVSTVEVEAAARRIGAVEMAAVLPPTEDRGSLIVVAGEISPATVLRELATHLEDFKVPTRCLVVDDLPLGPTGKIDKRALLARVSDRVTP